MNMHGISPFNTFSPNYNALFQPSCHAQIQYIGASLAAGTFSREHLESIFKDANLSFQIDQYYPQTAEEHVVCSYLKYKLGKISKESLFPYEIAETKGFVRDQAIKMHGKTGVYAPPYLPDQSVSHTQEPAFLLSIPTFIPTADYSHISNLFSKIYAESYGSLEAGKERIPSNVRIVLGCNRMYSLKKAANQHFKKYIQETPRHSYGHTLGFFWCPKWKIKGLNSPTEKDSYAIYKNAKKLLAFLYTIDSMLAEELYTFSEQPTTIKFRKIIPYAGIREQIRINPITSIFIWQLRAINSSRPLYYAIQDADPKNLNGTLAAYSKIITEKYQETKLLPVIGTTGYWPANDENPYIMVGVMVDQAVRQAISSLVFPYFPEPNTVALIGNQDSTFKYSFLKACSQCNGNESENLLANLVVDKCTAENIAKQTFYTINHPIVTDLSRFLKKSHSGFRPQLDAKTLSTLRGISQSCLKPLIWSKLVIRSLNYCLSKNEQLTASQLLVSDISKVLAAYNPIDLVVAKGLNFHHWNFHIDVLNRLSYVSSEAAATPILEQARMWGQSNGFWQDCHQITAVAFENFRMLSGIYHSRFKNKETQWEVVLNAAKESGQAIFRTLQQFSR